MAGHWWTVSQWTARHVNGPNGVMGGPTCCDCRSNVRFVELLKDQESSRSLALVLKKLLLSTAVSSKLLGSNSLRSAKSSAHNPMMVTLQKFHALSVLDFWITSASFYFLFERYLSLFGKVALEALISTFVWLYKLHQVHLFELFELWTCQDSFSSQQLQRFPAQVEHRADTATIRKAYLAKQSLVSFGFSLVEITQRNPRSTFPAQDSSDSDLSSHHKMCVYVSTKKCWETKEDGSPRCSWRWGAGEVQEVSEYLWQRLADETFAFFQ